MTDLTGPPDSIPPTVFGVPPHPVSSPAFSQRRKAFFALVALLAVFVLAEIVLRLVDFSFALTNLHSRFPGVGFAQYSQKHPDWFWELKPLIVMRDDRRGLIYEINRLGFRGIREWMPRKPKDTIRVLCLGDSCTFGLGVRFEDCYTVRLESMLNAVGIGKRVEALNAGSPGYSSYQGWRILERRLADFEPDVVTFYFGKNDVEAAFMYSDKEQNALRAFRLRAGLDRSRVYQLCSKGIAVAWRALARLRDAPTRALDDKAWREVNRGVRPGLLRVSADEFAENARNLIRLGAGRGFRVVLLTYPHQRADRGADVGNLDRLAEYNARLRELARGGDARLVDLAEAFVQRGQAGLFLDRDPVHPSPLGHDLIARELARALVKKGMARPGQE